MTGLRDNIIGLLSPDLCYRADRKADAILNLVVKEYEEFVFAIATKVSQRDARIAELEAQLARAEGTLDEARMACSDRAERLDNFSPEFECCAATARNCESDIDALIALEKKP